MASRPPTRSSTDWRTSARSFSFATSSSPSSSRSTSRPSLSSCTKKSAGRSKSACLLIRWCEMKWASVLSRAGALAGRLRRYRAKDASGTKIGSGSSLGVDRQAEARARRFGLTGEQRRRQRPRHVQQHGRLAGAWPADDHQPIAQPEHLVQSTSASRPVFGVSRSGHARRDGARAGQAPSLAHRRRAASTWRAAAHRRSPAATAPPARRPPARCRAARCSRVRSRSQRR